MFGHSDVYKQDWVVLKWLGQGIGPAGLLYKTGRIRKYGKFKYLNLLADRVAEGPLTQILIDSRDDPDVIEKILPMVYSELRAIAANHLRKENPAHTLMTTDLVHEAYLRMFSDNTPEWIDKQHFFASAAMAMRRILVDHARKKKSIKRIDPEAGLALSERASIELGLSQEELLDLDSALAELEGLDPRQAKIVNLKVFAGLTGIEISKLLGISPRTIAREWWTAKVWLHEQMSE